MVRETDGAAVVQRLGGTCSWRQLRRVMHWRDIGAAISSGAIVKRGRGTYALPAAAAGRVSAQRLTGTASHRTAALHWGWKVKAVPDKPDVTIPANRKLRPSAVGVATVHWRTLHESDIDDGWVTTKVRTVVDCCLDLPFDEALAVADSALRAGLARADLRRAALTLSARQRRKVIKVLDFATSRAANPFESVLRAIAIGASGTFEPQHRVRYEDFYAKVDLGDPDLEIVLEADSFEFHGQRKALDRDCERYDELVARGWLVLRFSWEQVMLRPEWVASVIRRVLDRRRAERRVDSSQGRMTGRTVDRASA